MKWGSSARGVGALMRKEWQDIVRERTILAAIFIQFIVAGFSAFLLVGLETLYDPSNLNPADPVEVAYVGPGGFDAYLARSNVVELDSVDLAAALDGFAGGQYVAVIEETAPNETSARSISVLVPDGEFQTTLIVSHMRQLLKEYQSDLREERAERIDTPLLDADLEPGSVRDFAFTYGALLPLLVLMPAMLAGAITTDTFLQERSTGTLRVLLSTPVGPFEIVLGKLLVPVILTPLQVGLWVFLMTTNGIPIDNVGLLVLLSTVLGLLFAAVGVLVAAFVRREGQAQAAYALAIIVLSLFAFFMPRDPLNLIAHITTGSTDAAVVSTLLMFIGLALVTTVVASLAAKRRLLVADA